MRKYFKCLALISSKIEVIPIKNSCSNNIFLILLMCYDFFFFILSVKYMLLYDVIKFIPKHHLWKLIGQVAEIIKQPEVEIEFNNELLDSFQTGNSCNHK